MFQDMINLFKAAPGAMPEYFDFIEAHIAPITDKDSLIKKIKKPQDDLYYHRHNLEEIFYKGNVSDAVAVFRYYYQIDWDFLGLETSATENYENDFSILTQSSLVSHIGLEIDKILQYDTKGSMLIFLFLYSMPHINKEDLLYLPAYKSHILASPYISHHNFLFVMELLENIENKGYNLNHQLVENMIKVSTELIGYSEIKWNEFLPVKKIEVLLDRGCTFKDFSFYQSRNTKNLAPTLVFELQEIEAMIRKNRLEEMLDEKETNQKLVKL